MLLYIPLCLILSNSLFENLSEISSNKQYSSDKFISKQKCSRIERSTSLLLAGIQPGFDSSNLRILTFYEHSIRTRLEQEEKRVRFEFQAFSFTIFLQYWYDSDIGEIVKTSTQPQSNIT